MENIFENAKFGDIFKTKGNKYGMLWWQNCNSACLIFPDDANEQMYWLNGKSMSDQELDIVEELSNEETIKALFKRFDEFYESNEIPPYNAAYDYFRAGYLRNNDYTKDLTELIKVSEEELDDIGTKLRDKMLSLVSGYAGDTKKHDDYLHGFRAGYRYLREKIKALLV